MIQAPAVCFYHRKKGLQEKNTLTTMFFVFVDTFFKKNTVFFSCFLSMFWAPRQPPSQSSLVSVLPFIS